MNFFFRPQRSQLTRKRTHNRVCSVQPRCPTAISAVPPPQRRLSIKITTLGAAPLAAAASSVRRGLRDPGLRAPLAAAPWPGSGHLGRGLAGVDAVRSRSPRPSRRRRSRGWPRRAARAAWRCGVDAGQDSARGTLPWDGRDGVGGEGACSAKFGPNLPWCVGLG